MSVAQRLQIALMVPPFYSGVRMSQHAQSLNLKQLSGIQPSLIVPVVFLLWQNLFLKKSQSAAKQNDGGEKNSRWLNEVKSSYYAWIQMSRLHCSLSTRGLVRECQRLSNPKTQRSYRYNYPAFLAILTWHSFPIAQKTNLNLNV